MIDLYTCLNCAFTSWFAQWFVQCLACTHGHTYLLTCLSLVQMWIHSKLHHQPPQQQHHTPREPVCMHTYSLCLFIIIYLLSYQLTCWLARQLAHLLVEVLSYTLIWSCAQSPSWHAILCSITFMTCFHHYLIFLFNGLLNLMLTLLLNSSPTDLFAYIAPYLLVWQGAATAWPTPIFHFLSCVIACKFA